jgi:hypothetical protein
MMQQYRYVVLVSFLSMAVIIPTTSFSQRKASTRNTSYVEQYTNKWTVRIFSGKKYAPFELPAPNNNFQDLVYKPNTKFTLGIGVTYKNLTANLGFGVGFLNKDYNKDGKGDTKGLGLDIHLFPKRYAIDLIGIFHKGHNLNPRGTAASPGNYYFRPDTKINLIGLAGYVLTNADRFSYRASFAQNQWQKKSAGTVLYGGEANYITFAGDSALVPKAVQGSYPQAGVTKVKVFSIGPGVGYAYTLVLAKRFFATGSLIGNVQFNFSDEERGTTSAKKTSVKPAAVYKAAVGYNGARWSLAATTAGNGYVFAAASSNKNYLMQSGNFRLTLAHKFGVLDKQ